MAGVGRVAFFGSGAFAVPLLEVVSTLADELLVVTQPERPAGRGMRERGSPVARSARSHGLEVLTPARLRSEEARAAVRAFRPDGILLAAYGQLVPGELLAAGSRLPLNVHPSLLPRHRGAAPIPAAILAGDRETGVTLMVMTEELDAGPIVDQWRLPLAGDEETPTLEAALARLAADAIGPLLRTWTGGGLHPEPQDATLATYSRAFRREDGRIDWSGSATVIDRRVRALQPWPGAWTTLGDRRLHVRRAQPMGDAAPPRGSVPGTLAARDRDVAVACGEGWLRLLVVQPEGRPAMPAAAWFRGLRDGTGSAPRLGASVEEA